MERTKLILVEGLPGSGKSTTAQLIHDILLENDIETQLFLEGNLGHPADYDGASYFSKEEYTDLLTGNDDFKTAFTGMAEERKNGYIIPRFKLSSELPDSLKKVLYDHDIYELPLDIHIELITGKWQEFCRKALHEEKIYIFECCFIQNPVTIGMVKYGAKEDPVIRYIERLAKIIEPLEPWLFYVDQQDVSKSFTKVAGERPEDWFNGFVQYYTQQGFGREIGADGLKGTLKVLQARKSLESVIYSKLQMKKTRLDNSQFEIASYRQDILNQLGIIIKNG
ncbi:hypothetical protein AB1K84_08645 [Mesobacillus foraminis]|uniref:hypothetical protein n=1 Tax=Mesobacillus foraminis TaxID=279826 RepID=UPI0039A208F0